MLDDEQPVETTLYSLATVPPGMPERRHDERHMTLLRVGSLLVDDRRELCLIRNISAGGMLIRAYSAIPAGTRVSIELKQGEPVAGTTLWAKDDLVGVSFDAPIDILSLITTPPNSPRPRMPRLEVSCVAWVRDGAVVHRLRVVNISQGGVRVEALNGPPTAAQVTVHSARHASGARRGAMERRSVLRNHLQPRSCAVPTRWVGRRAAGTATRGRLARYFRCTGSATSRTLARGIICDEPGTLDHAPRRLRSTTGMTRSEYSSVAGRNALARAERRRFCSDTG